MDKQEIKELMHMQASSFNEDVASKLEYLKGDDVFQEYETDNSGNDNLNKELEEALFSESYSKHKSAETVQFISPEVPQTSHFSQNIKVQTEVSPQAVPQNQSQAISSSKQRVAEKIAALRGISLAGDYIRR